MKLLNKNISFCRILYFFAIFSICPSVFLKTASGFVLKNEQLISAVSIFVNQCGYTLDEGQLRTNLDKLASLNLVTSEEQFYKNIIQSVRRQGIFLNAFAVEYKDIRKFKKSNEPFIALLKGKYSCCVVDKIIVKPHGFKFYCIMPDGKKIYMNEQDFISRWKGGIFSRPLVGIEAKRLFYRQGSSKFEVFYLYHSGVSFDSFRENLDELRNEARKGNKKLIYIDELGLIPEETIQRYMKMDNLGEKEAFEKVKDMLQRDINNIEKGIAIYGEPNPFYRKLYQYLARNRVKSFMEDLQYERWKEIVTFDSLRYYDKAVNYFFFNNIDKYLESIERFVEGYWEYNIKKRDEDFRGQIDKIMQEYPDSIIFTIRGIGHYGMEEKLNIKNCVVKTLVLGNGAFEDNILHSQIYYIMLSNGVVMKEHDKRTVFLKTYLEDTLRAYFKKRGMNISEATRKVCKISKRLQEKDVLKFSQAIYYCVIKQPEELSDMWTFTYNWLKGQGFITEEDLKSIQK